MLTPVDLAKKIGSKVLFIGTEAYQWQVADYVKAAQNARKLGFDTISPKAADGQIKWYKTPANFTAIRNAVLAQGCGFLPFHYIYGPRFGDGQVRAEAAVAKEIASLCDGLVCLDMEVEWNGKVDAAKLLAKELAGTSYDFIISTWADPVQQNWMGVLKALDPVASAWGPQEYTTWLSGQEDQFRQAGINTDKIFPSIDVADSYTGMDPLQSILAAVSRGHRSIWIWEYNAVMTKVALVQSMISAVLTPPAPVTQPVALPHPEHGNAMTYGSYTIKGGDTLSKIATQLGVHNWFSDLYVPNKAVLDGAARQHGVSSSGGGNLVYSGTVLRYPIFA
jgi:hypothetical protein